MSISSKTSTRLQEILRKIKSTTGKQEFKNRDEVIDLAVEQLYEQFKKQRLL
jgi:Arc/MetJ-type ribon-helix-helix transcriptional regulator